MSGSRASQRAWLRSLRLAAQEREHELIFSNDASEAKKERMMDANEQAAERILKQSQAQAIRDSKNKLLVRRQYMMEIEKAMGMEAMM